VKSVDRVLTLFGQKWGEDNMKSKWIIQNHKDKLLLFLNGWGMDETPFQHLTSETHDVIMFYDYKDLTFPLDTKTLFRPYKEIYLLAWSFGVWVSQSLKDILPDRTVFSVAVNGTLQPIDPKYGIVPNIFDKTLTNLTPASLEHFYRNMFVEDDEESRFFTQLPGRAFDDQAQELTQLGDMIKTEPPAREAMGYDMTIISSRDLIMPAKSQLRFWKNQSTCQVIRCGHFPFYRWQRWEDIFVHVSHE
jgi:pimeloyl-[acyl-carrier protein] methyl ester esterase